MLRDGIAVDPLALLGEPFDEGGRVGDFAFRFGERFTLLGGHDLRQIVEVFMHEIEPRAQQAGPFACRLRTPYG